jgi:hypothetical protein
MIPVHPTGLVAWIGERHPDIGCETIATVLEIEFEYMIATGICAPDGDSDFDERRDFVYRYYKPDELADASPIVDTLRLARDAERLRGVPRSVAQTVLDAEVEFMELRGLA